MASKHLLVCFDAFGTLFKPRYAVAKQYGDVARALGHSGFSDEDVSRSFKLAFKSEAEQNPNYGKANGMNAEKWWANIIRNTFQPLLEPEQSLHKDLVPKLLHRFWCDEGYMLFPDVMPLLKQLREAHTRNGTRLVIGVITNSDDRVPDVLSALGLRVATLRYAAASQMNSVNAGPHDIDFFVMSYDVGCEKPDRRIFLAAEEMLGHVLGTDSPQASVSGQWQKVYVGDEYDKDVVGALNASWNAVLIQREGTSTPGDVRWLDEEPVGSLDEVFRSSKAVGFSTLAGLAQWFPSKQ